MEFEKEKNVISKKSKKARKQYKLEELLSQITPEHRHEEIDFGIKGRELI